MKKTILLTLIILLAASLIQAQVTNRSTSTGYATITNAINNAANGHLIEVEPGTYDGNIIINNLTSLTLRSTAWESSKDNTSTIIDATGLGNGIIIANSTNCRIYGFTIANAVTNGVKLGANNSSNFIGYSVIISNGVSGVFMQDNSSADTTIYSNIINENQTYGIYNEASSGTIILYNTCNKNGIQGIYINNDNGDNITIQYNTVTESQGSGNNQCNIYVNRSDYVKILDNYVSRGLGRGVQLNGNAQYCIVSNNIICSNDKEGFRNTASAAFNNTIISNKIFNNLDGMFLRNIKYNKFLGNSIYNNSARGIECQQLSFSNVFAGNNIYANTNDGIRLFRGPYWNIVSNNKIHENHNDGIEISGDANNSYSNRIVNNNIYGNTNSGILLSRGFSEYIGGNSVSMNGVHGIDIAKDTNYINKDHIIEDNVVYQNASQGIRIQGARDIQIMYSNRVYMNGDDGIQMDGVTNIIIENNIIYSNGRGVYNWDGNGISRNCQIKGNKVYGNTKSGNNSNGIEVQGFAFIVEGNFVYNNEDGIRISSGTDHKVRKNTIYNNNDNGIQIQSDITNCVFQSNTIYGQNSGSGAGIFCTGGNNNNHQILDNDIYNNDIGMRFTDASFSYIYRNKFYRNSIGFSCADLPNCEVQQNLIATNSNIGVLFTAGLEPIIQYNNIYSNADANYSNTSGAAKDISNNWWGSAVEATIAGTIKNNGANANFIPYRLFGPFDIAINGDITSDSAPSVSVSVSSGNVTVSWTKASISDFTRYFVYKSPKAGTANVTPTNIVWQTNDINSTNYLDTIAVSQTNYYYVTILDDGTSGNIYTNECWYSAAAMATGGLPQSAPGSFSVSSLFIGGSTNTLLTWADASGELGYVISTNTNAAPIKLLAPDVTSWTDANVIYGQSITYYIQATNDFSKSPWISTNITISITPGTPVLSIQLLSATSVELSWNSTGDTTGYIIYTNSLAAGAVLSRVSSAVTAITDTTALPGETNTYYLIATNIAAQSAAASNTVSMVTPVAASLKKIKLTEDGYVQLSWNLLPNATGYTIYRATSKNGTKEAIAVLDSATSTYTDEDVEGGNTYYYWIRAFNEVGGADLSPPQSIKLERGAEFADALGAKIGPTTVVGSGKLYIEAITEDTEITIYDVAGKEVYKIATDDIDIEGDWFYISPTDIGLVNGMYLILFSNGTDKSIVKKFIVIREVE